MNLYSLSVLPLRLNPLTEDTSMITVSSCGVKLQEVLSGLDKKAKTLDRHMHFCGFSQHSLVLSTWGVIFSRKIDLHQLTCRFSERCSLGLKDYCIVIKKGYVV